MICTKAHEAAFSRDSEEGFGWPGMTMREWYAGMALQGLIAAGIFRMEDGTPNLDHTAAIAFRCADHMLTQAAKDSP